MFVTSYDGWLNSGLQIYIQGRNKECGNSIHLLSRKAESSLEPLADILRISLARAMSMKASNCSRHRSGCIELLWLLGWRCREEGRGFPVSYANKQNCQRERVSSIIFITYFFICRDKRTEGMKNSALAEQDFSASFAIILPWIGDLNLLGYSLPHLEPDTRLYNL